MSDPTDLAKAVAALLPAYLGRQRWFAGDEPGAVDVVTAELLSERLLWLLVDAGGARYQVFAGLAEADEPPEFLHGHDSALMGDAMGWLAFDGLLDGDLAMLVLARVSPGEQVERVRPMGVEQTNTSLVFDDRLVLKVFRRLQDGPNPDVEVTGALAEAGFASVAAPTGTWKHGEADLAVVQPFLSGGAEGWALALASLRDLYASGCDDPADCGGDFAGEAGRLGAITARMHVALAAAFGRHPADRQSWVDLIGSQLGRLQPGDADVAAANALAGRLGGAGDCGAAIRVHGDYHLGQVLRTDSGWYVLDFEGEPARPLAERRQPSSAFKDVAGMLRSFDYAAHVVLSERDELEQDELRESARRWERRNRAAFLDAYFAEPGIDDLLPASVTDRDTLLDAFELDKAVYEVLYERAHRPDWVNIPLRAISRLLGG